MTVADTNVRPAWRSPAANARGTRRFGLARLLLEQLGRLLRKLDLTFLVLFAVAPTPACILPIGPEWQDPVGNPNAKPRILNPDPFWGAEVTGVPNDPPNFEFYVIDANGEDLDIQGFVDGPNRFLDTTAGNTRVPQRIAKTIVCADLDRTLVRHNIIVGVTDSLFVVDGSDNVLRTKDNEEPAIVTWQLTMTCQGP
jgi:hypothetical protein